MKNNDRVTVNLELNGKIRINITTECMGGANAYLSQNDAIEFCEQLFATLVASKRAIPTGDN